MTLFSSNPPHQNLKLHNPITDCSAQVLVRGNPGRHEISMKFKFADYQKLVNPEVVKVST